MPLHNPVVKRAIAERLSQCGRLSFAELMAIALYLPEHGYYARSAGLAWQDYRTSPSVHPVFGALIALQLEQMWAILGQPPQFTIVEVGAGDAALGRDVVAFSAQLATSFAKALNYVVVEQRMRYDRIGAATAPVGNAGYHWVAGSALALPFNGLVGCVLSNELVDALPVHRVVRQGGELFESYVVARDGDLTFELCELSTPLIARHLAGLGVQPPEGSLVEVNLAAPQYIAEAARVLGRGFLLTIDYGGASEDLYSGQRPDGSLRCFHRHQVNGNPLQALGTQDITAPVDFSTLIAAGRESGLRLSGLTNQRDFLLNLGFDYFVKRLEQADLPAARRHDNLFALRELNSSAGLGSFRVLIQHKGVHDPELHGFNPCNDLKRGLVSGDRRLTVPFRHS